MKKILSLLFSLILAVNIFTVSMGSTPLTAEAADYAAELRSKGFPESYIDDIVKLHKQYPNWISHSKQVLTGLRLLQVNAKSIISSLLKKTLIILRICIATVHNATKTAIMLFRRQATGYQHRSMLLNIIWTQGILYMRTTFFNLKV